MVTIKPYLDCRKQKQDGSYPLKLRISSKRKSFYLATSFSLETKHWDQKKLKVRSHHPNHRLLNLFIFKKTLEVEEIILLHANPEGLSIMELRQLIERRQNPVGVCDFTRQIIANMESENKHGNAQVYSQARQTGILFR